MSTKKYTSGGAKLLETKGKEYFSELAKKGAKKRKLALKLYDKQLKEKARAKRLKVPVM